MSDFESTVPATVLSADPRAPATRRAPPALQTCLVVSTSPRRAQLFARAAHEELWATMVCSTADDALRQTVQQRIDLGLIDLQSAERMQVAPLRTLVEKLAHGRNAPLLAVCGKPDDTTGEVWSRQLGVWMYLPGVDSQSDIALLCAEARGILQKINNHAAQTAR
jgi:hypothetical protein